MGWLAPQRNIHRPEPRIFGPGDMHHSRVDWSACRRAGSATPPPGWWERADPNVKPWRFALPDLRSPRQRRNRGRRPDRGRRPNRCTGTTGTPTTGRLSDAGSESAPFATERPAIRWSEQVVLFAEGAYARRGRLSGYHSAGRPPSARLSPADDVRRVERPIAILQLRPQLVLHEYL